MKRIKSQRGIALGPILFIIAILAILAAAIAAGTGGFSGGIGTEKAKLMAQAIVNQCRDYQTAMDLMVTRNSCDEKKLDYTRADGQPA